MDLLILKSATRSDVPGYQGASRINPSYQEDLDENHPVNQAFRWYLREGGEIGVVHDLSLAISLVSAYSRLVPPQQFEVVEVATADRPPIVGGVFLGYDLTDLFESLLFAGFQRLEYNPSANVPADAPYHLLSPLVRLIKVHFEPQLNFYGLFGDYESAKFCLDCMKAAQHLCPNLLEDDPIDRFEVWGLWRVFAPT